MRGAQIPTGHQYSKQDKRLLRAQKGTRAKKGQCPRGPAVPRRGTDTKRDSAAVLEPPWPFQGLRTGGWKATGTVTAGTSRPMALCSYKYGPASPRLGCEGKVLRPHPDNLGWREGFLWMGDTWVCP